MTKTLIERDDQTGRFNFVVLDRDGGGEVISDHATRAEATTARAAYLSDDLRAEEQFERYLGIF